MKEVLNVGVIGLGNRGSNLLENCILPQPGVRVPVSYTHLASWKTTLF